MSPAPTGAERAALYELALGYAAAADALDGPGYAAVFTDDGELVVPDLHASDGPTVVRAGREKLVRTPSGLAGYRRTHHAVWSADYDVDGDRATGIVTGVAHHLTPDTAEGATGGLDAVWYLRYVDEYVHSGAGWLLCRRTLEVRDIEERRIRHVGPGRP